MRQLFAILAAALVAAGGVWEIEQTKIADLQDKLSRWEDEAKQKANAVKTASDTLQQMANEKLHLEGEVKRLLNSLEEEKKGRVGELNSYKEAMRDQQALLEAAKRQLEVFQAKTNNVEANPMPVKVEAPKPTVQPSPYRGGGPSTEKVAAINLRLKAIQMEIQGLASRKQQLEGQWAAWQRHAGTWEPHKTTNLPAQITDCDIKTKALNDEVEGLNFELSKLKQ